MHPKQLLHINSLDDWTPSALNYFCILWTVWHFTLLKITWSAWNSGRVFAHWHCLSWCIGKWSLLLSVLFYKALLTQSLITVNRLCWASQYVEMCNSNNNKNNEFLWWTWTFGARFPSAVVHLETPGTEESFWKRSLRKTLGTLRNTFYGEASKSFRNEENAMHLTDLVYNSLSSIAVWRCSQLTCIYV